MTRDVMGEAPRQTPRANYIPLDRGLPDADENDEKGNRAVRGATSGVLLGFSSGGCGRLTIHLLLRSENAAPVFVLGDGHAALYTDTNPLTRLRLSGKQLRQKGHQGSPLSFDGRTGLSVGTTSWILRRKREGGSGGKEVAYGSGFQVQRAGFGSGFQV